MEGVYVERDQKTGRVKSLEHFQQPYAISEGLRGKSLTAKELADQYLTELSPLMELDQAMVKGTKKNMDENKLTVGSETENELEFNFEKPAMGTTVVTYGQTYMGVPIVDGGVTVYVNNNPMQVTRSQNSVHYDIEVKRPDPNVRFMPGAFSKDLVYEMFGLSKSVKNKDQINVYSTRLLVYQYKPDLRIDPKTQTNEEFGRSIMESMVLPDLAPTIQPDKHYFVTEVIFSFSLLNWAEPINWRAYIEVETGSLLYLFALIEFIDGFVLSMDPLRGTGDNSIRPTSAENILNPLRMLVTLQGLGPPSSTQGRQELKGDLVQLVDLSNPTTPPPSEPTPASFRYSVATDNFAAVNAYYHSHNVFQMAKDMGFPFVRTRFPVRVDHRAIIGSPVDCPNGNCLNASAPMAQFGGSDGFRFALAERNTSFGIANCFDIVLHEFCHSLLEESVNHPNLGFAHNCGDALAAILCDPDSKSQDRGKTFYVNIDRRHDRKVGEGWAWGGIRDTGFPANGGYRSEQILSTSMFRTYKAIGGDSTSKDVRKNASNYMTFLILKTLGTVDPNTRAGNAREFVSILINSDRTTIQFNGFKGGQIGKVIRWAFEKQGLFQPPGSQTPVNREGAPPEVDVYVDDGRNGEYEYQNSQAETNDICNRINPDGVSQHQDPVVNSENFIYVKIKNRGTLDATEITVKGFSSNKSDDVIFPNDWVA